MTFRGNYCKEISKKRQRLINEGLVTCKPHYQDFWKTCGFYEVINELQSSAQKQNVIQFFEQFPRKLQNKVKQVNQ